MAYLTIFLMILGSNSFGQTNENWLTLNNYSQNSKQIKLKFENTTTDTVFIPRLNGNFVKEKIQLTNFSFDNSTLIINLSVSDTIHFSAKPYPEWHTEGIRIKNAYFLIPGEKIEFIILKENKSKITFDEIEIILSNLEKIVYRY